NLVRRKANQRVRSQRARRRPRWTIGIAVAADWRRGHRRADPLGVQVDGSPGSDVVAGAVEGFPDPYDWAERAPGWRIARYAADDARRCKLGSQDSVLIDGCKRRDCPNAQTGPT